MSNLPEESYDKKQLAELDEAVKHAKELVEFKEKPGILLDAIASNALENLIEQNNDEQVSTKPDMKNSDTEEQRAGRYPRPSVGYILSSSYYYEEGESEEQE